MANVKPVALTAGAPVDLQAQQASYAQQLAIAQALIAKSMEDHSPVIRTAAGNPFSRDVPNIGDPVADVARAFMGAKQRDEANAGLSRVAAETDRITKEDMGKILAARMGIEEGQGPPTAEGEYPPPQLGRPNFFKAADIARTSRSPAVNAYHMKLMEQIPNPEEVMKIAPQLDSASLAQYLQTGDPSVLKGRGKVEIKDNIATSTQDENVLGTRPVQQFETKEVMPGLPASVSKDTNEAKGIGGGTTTPPAKFEEQYTAMLTKDLPEAKQQYIQNMEKLQSVAQVREQLKNIPDNALGTAASLRNSFGRFTEMVSGGQYKLPATDKMETLHASLGQFLLQDIRKVAPVTKDDIKVIQEIVGTEGYTKRGLEKIMDVVEASTARAMEMHRSNMKEMPLPQNITREQHMKMFAPDFSIKPISAGGEPTSGTRVIRYNEW